MNPDCAGAGPAPDRGSMIFNFSLSRETDSASRDWQACLQSVAPLLLARFAIIVSVHLGVGAMPEEIGSFRARSHLRAMGTPIASELRFCLRGCSSLCLLLYSATGRKFSAHAGLRRVHGHVFSVAVPGQCGQHCKNDKFFMVSAPLIAGLNARIKNTWIKQIREVGRPG